jgi:hypothetical protein
VRYAGGGAVIRTVGIGGAGGRDGGEAEGVVPRPERARNTSIPTTRKSQVVPFFGCVGAARRYINRS